MRDLPVWAGIQRTEPTGRGTGLRASQWTTQWRNLGLASWRAGTGIVLTPPPRQAAYAAPQYAAAAVPYAPVGPPPHICCAISSCCRRHRRHA
eukprot:11459722-Alexandrium_andersonii.AAC.1